MVVVLFNTLSALVSLSITVLPDNRHNSLVKAWQAEIE